jgi:Zn-dependent protease with chaperone function
MKKIFIIFAIAVVHLAVCKAIVSIFLASASGSVFDGQASSFGKILIWITKVLYFPILTLSLYSRQWFPGKLIYIPMYVNSLLWGIVIYFSVIYCLKLFRRN